jgi:hypothetical protein
MFPSGKTIDECEQDEPEEPEEDEEEEVSEEEVKPAKKARGGNSNNKKNDKNAGRPKRATASRVWTNGNLLLNVVESISISLFQTSEVVKKRKLKKRDLELVARSAGKILTKDQT